MKGTLGHLSASYRGKAARDQALNWLRKSVPSEKRPEWRRWNMQHQPRQMQFFQAFIFNYSPIPLTTQCMTAEIKRRLVCLQQSIILKSRSTILGCNVSRLPVEQPDVVRNNGLWIASNDSVNLNGICFSFLLAVWF